TNSPNNTLVMSNAITTPSLTGKGHSLHCARRKARHCSDFFSIWPERAALSGGPEEKYFLTRRQLEHGLKSHRHTCPQAGTAT
ncbi:MAG: hypothetical protein P4N59_11205, partial [Negativicutes bacterium]|nr:hypothetical protein [Negativicutes bacterium]